MSTGLTQKIVYETCSLDCFEKVLDQMVRIIYESKPSDSFPMHITTIRPFGFDEGRTLIDSIHWSNPRFMHICSIEEDYLDNTRIMDGDQLFRDRANIVARVMEHLKTADVNRFFRECGNGFHVDSDHHSWDATASAGYRLSHRSNSPRNLESLDISLCHVYKNKQKYE